MIRGKKLYNNIKYEVKQEVEKNKILDLSMRSMHLEHKDYSWKYLMVIGLFFLILIFGSDMVNYTYAMGTVEQWENEKIWVELMTNGGTGVSSSVSADRHDCVDFLTPTKTGYTFDGWYKESTFDTRVTSTCAISKIVTVDDHTIRKDATTVVRYITYDVQPNHATVYAKWSSKCVDLNGGSFSINFDSDGGSTVTSITQCVGCATNNTLPTPTKKGAVFQGWYTDKNYTKKVTTTGQISPTVKKDSNGCTTGYYGVTLYALWSEIHCEDMVGGAFSIQFDSAGGSAVAPITQCVGCGSSETLPLPTRSGYTFDGWYTDKNYTKKVATTSMVPQVRKYDDLGCAAGYEVATLYAKWTKISCTDINGGSYKLNYNTNGGNSILYTSVCVACGSYSSLPTPTKAGYTFAGWYYDQGLTRKVNTTTVNVGTNPVYSSAGCLTGYAEVTIYARWTKDSCPAISSSNYTLKFETNGGNSITNISVPTTGNSYGDLPKPTRSGYTFAGWYYDSEFKKVVNTKTINVGTSEIYDASGCLKGYKDVTIYARWTKENSCTDITGGSYTLKFEPNGGSSVTSATVCVGCSTYNKLPVPLKTGSEFMGWYSDTNLTKSVGDTTKNISPIAKYSSEGCITGYEQITLYAKWSTTSYTSINGTLVDDNGKAYKNYTITLDDDSITTTTDNEGKFTIIGATVGKHKLTAKDSSNKELGSMDLVVSSSNKTDLTNNVLAASDDISLAFVLKDNELSIAKSVSELKGNNIKLYAIIGTIVVLIGAIIYLTISEKKSSKIK